MKRLGCSAIFLLALAILAIALSAYRAQDYRARFARAAGELVAIRDSTEVGRTADGYRVTEVTLVSDTGLQVRVRVRSPGLMDGVRRPAAIVLGGYKTSAGATEVPPTTGGLVLASPSYPYRDSDRPRGIGWLWGVFRIRHAMMQTPPAVLLLAQYLYAREDVDPDRVSIIGVSLGVPFATVAAATDRRLAGAALLHGGGDVSMVFAGVYRDRLPGWALGPLAQAVELLLAPLEPTKYVGAISPRPLYMINATDDELIPRPSVLALYRAAGRPKRILWLDSRHVALSEERMLAELMDETLAWMTAAGLR